MSTDTTTAEPAEEVKPEQARPEHTKVHLAYGGLSSVIPDEGVNRLALFTNLQRDPVRANGQVKHPLRLREALSLLHGIVASDFRYVPKDRTAYMAYMRMKREAAGMGMWAAQQAYYAWLQRNDPLAFVGLDPVVTAHPDQLLFEVFSKDEGTYASLGIDWKAFTLDGTPIYGTTNIDFSQTLYQAIQQLRSYRPTRISLGKEQPKAPPVPGGEKLDKNVNIPDSWLRGFLQVQSAATFPLDTFQLAPIDLYNVLRHLRLNGDRKGQRRGVRIELVPGEPARVVLEPWEVVVSSSAGMYRGRAAKVVRVWGRRRLMLLRRLLPFVESVEVHLMGSGLPSFWVFRAGEITLTLGLTGFTTSNWSQALNFDLLLPRKTQTTKPLEAVLDHLKKVWYASTQDLSKATGLKGATLLEVLQTGCQQGRLMYDLASDVFRLRPITDAPLDLERLEYRNQRERVAHDLLVRRGAVKIATENRIPACTHLIALRLAYAEQESKRKKSGDPRQTVTVETRTFTKRDEEGEHLIQLSLERQKLKVRWGLAGKAMRLQTLTFNTVDEARAAYFVRIDEADARGYLDATAG